MLHILLLLAFIRHPLYQLFEVIFGSLLLLSRFITTPIPLLFQFI